jgi:hypothetical protein
MIDSLLEDDALTVPCRFVYSGNKFTKCPNCKFNGITQKSANIYQSGGPIAFSKGTCPFCSGEGKIAAESDSEIINLAVIWEPRKFLSVGQVIKNPELAIQTICSMALINRIKKVKELVVDTNIEKFVRHNFIRAGEPTPIGFGADQYIVTMWSRSGG